MTKPVRLAAAAAISVPLLAGLVIAATTVAPTASAADQSATTCPTDSPTPSLPALPSPTIAPTLCPDASPTPTAAATPTPSNTSSSGSGSSSSGSGTTAGAGSSASGPLAAAAKAGPPIPTAIPGTLVVADPLLAAQLTSVLQNPVSRQRPDLLHFAPSFATPSDDPPAPSSLSWTGTAAPIAIVQPALALGVAALLLAGAGFTLLRGARLPSRLRLAMTAVPAALALPLSFAALILLAPPGPAATLASGPAPSPASAPLGLVRGHVTTLQAAAVAPWTALVGIEGPLTQQHGRLVFDEAEIVSLTSQLNAASVGGSAPRSRRPATTGILTANLAWMVNDHQTALTSYQQSLQNEYDFFVSTVKSAPTTTQLQAVAAHTPPEVQTAVNTDITLVQTQLQQEAAIAAASAAPVPTLAPPVLPARFALKFHAPLSGVVTQPFGPTQYSLEPPVTYQGVFYPHFHTGLDIAAPLDTPVGAAAAGRVILATSSRDEQGHLVGYGNYIVIAHGDGFLTLYGHLDKLLVTAGQMVKQGQVIGLCGSTGWSSGPHVHFEIRKDGTFVDPAPYLARQLRP